MYKKKTQNVVIDVTKQITDKTNYGLLSDCYLNNGL